MKNNSVFETAHSRTNVSTKRVLLIDPKLIRM